MTKRIPHTVDFQIDGTEFDLYRDVTRFVKRESARAAAQDEDPRARAIGFLMSLYQRRLTKSLVTAAPTAAPTPNKPVLAVALAAAANHGVDLLSGCCSLGSLGLRYASIPRRRISNAIVRDFRKRISSIRRSSLSSINRQSASSPWP
jgi:hypothetical protein